MLYSINKFKYNLEIILYISKHFDSYFYLSLNVILKDFRARAQTEKKCSPIISNKRHKTITNDS